MGVTPGPAGRAHRAASSAGQDAELALRRGLLVVVAAVAVTAVLAGLARLGVGVGWGPSYAADHGALFVLGVFTTVIGLERAVALARPWSFAAPGLGAIAAVGMLAGLSWARWAALASSVALVAVNAAIVRKQSAAFTWLMLLGSGVLAFANGAWAIGRPVFEIVSGWIAFFVLTIVAERLELSRLAPTPAWATRALVALAALVSAAALAGASGVAPATRVLGGAMMLVAAWQLRFDLARRTVRQRGLPRYAAAGVLLGAGWLFVAGALLARGDLPPAGPLYDAVLHAIFVGYVLSMVFAHAPIILPAVARVSVPFTGLLYAPLAVLHAGLLARVIGDVAEHAELRRAGAITNALALALFFVAVALGRRVARAASVDRRQG